MLYPQQNDIRNLLNISGFWQFKLDPDEVGEGQGWQNRLESPRTIAVPGSWNEQLDDAYHYLGMAWYLRDDVYMPSAWRGQRIFIRVGSANYFGQVWVNGVAVGQHEGGHLPFAFDVTDQVKWGEANTIAVQVENHLKPTRVPAGNFPVDGNSGFGMRGSYPAATFDFYPFAGIHRPVIVYAVPQESIDDITVTTSIEGTSGIVSVEVKATGKAGRIRLAGQEASLTFVDGTAEATLTVPDARLWSPDDPYLYPLEVALTENDQITDRYTLDVGIRTVEVKDSQLLLNGQPIYLKGFGRHEDFYASGRGLNQPLIVKDYSLMKWIGANSYRTSHYPYSEEEMMMADREGMLIIDEIPAVSLTFLDGPENINARLAMCKQQLNELVARDKNHPCVIMWSVANEPIPSRMAAFFGGGGSVGDPGEEIGQDFLHELIELSHNLDASRPAILVGVMMSPTEWLALSDIVFINRYYGWYSHSGRMEQGKAALEQELDMLHEKLGKPIIISEFGADTVAGMHTHPPKVFSEEYQVEFIRAYLDAADERDFVIGMHIWNFADFQATQSTNRVGGMNLKGVFTRAREPKMAAHFLRERWNKS